VDEIAQELRASTQNALGALTRTAGRLPPARVAIDMVNPSTLGAPQGWIDEIGEEAATKLKDQLIAHGRKMDQGNALATAATDVIDQRARQVGFRVEDAMLSNETGVLGPIGDVADSPGKYARSMTPEQRSFLNDLDSVLREQNAVEKAAGVKKGEIFSEEGRYFPRSVAGARGVENMRAEVKRIVGGKQGFQKGRFYETMQEGLDNGVNYGGSFGSLVGTRIRAGMKAVSDSELGELVRPLGRTYKQPLTGPQIGEVGTMVPALGGRAFPRETGIGIMEQLNPAPPGATLRGLDAINSLLRPIQATGDLSLVGVQLITGTARNPVASAKGAFYMLDGLITDGRMYGRYAPNNADWIERYVAGDGVWNGGEFTFESLRGRLGGIIKKGTGRFDQSFNWGGNVAAIEHFKAFVGLGMKDTEAAIMASKLVGRHPSRYLGVKATQRAVESSLAFAPRMYRATFGLLADALQGGMKGNEARRILGSLMVGAVTAHVAAAYALGQEPNLDPRTSKFLTVRLKGVNVGPGGPVYGIMRLASDAAENPKTLTRINMDNPAVRWARGRLSPVLSLAVDMIKGEDYMGRKLDSPADFLKHAATSALPFGAQTAIEEGPVEAASQFVGGRGFPVSEWDTFKEAFRERKGRDYKGSANDRAIAEQDPQLAAMLSKADASFGADRERRNAQLEAFEQEHGLPEQAQAIQRGEGKPEEFRNAIGEERDFYGALVATDLFGVEFPESTDERSKLYRAYADLQRGDFTGEDAEGEYRAAKDAAFEALPADLKDAMQLSRRSQDPAVRAQEAALNKDRQYIEGVTVEMPDGSEANYWDVRGVVAEQSGVGVSLSQLEALARQGDQEAEYARGWLSYIDKEAKRYKDWIRQSDPALDARLYYWGYRDSLATEEAYTTFGRLYPNESRPPRIVES
jgi:hypothetical protein